MEESGLAVTFPSGMAGLQGLHTSQMKMATCPHTALSLLLLLCLSLIKSKAPIAAELSSRCDGTHRAGTACVFMLTSLLSRSRPCPSLGSPPRPALLSPCVLCHQLRLCLVQCLRQLVSLLVCRG